jgi:hypothetical protein
MCVSRCYKEVERSKKKDGERLAEMAAAHILRSLEVYDDMLDDQKASLHDTVAACSVAMRGFLLLLVRD